MRKVVQNNTDPDMMQGKRAAKLFLYRAPPRLQAALRLAMSTGAGPTADSKSGLVDLLRTVMRTRSS
jgi:hypothetical protein